MKNACEGVLYPVDAASKIELPKATSSVKTIKLKAKEELLAYLVPHASWQYCKTELENLFSFLNQTLSDKDKVEKIILLAPLHKGPINYDDAFRIYCPEDGILRGSDWEIRLTVPEEIKRLPFVVQADDVCTEEHSLEVVAPFISKFFPQAQVCYLLAPSKAKEIAEVTSILKKQTKAIVLLSSNEATNCAYMWKARG